jgi:hypothetical protein
MTPPEILAAIATARAEAWAGAAQLVGALLRAHPATVPAAAIAEAEAVLRARAEVASHNGATLVWHGQSNGEIPLGLDPDEPDDDNAPDEQAPAPAATPRTAGNVDRVMAALSQATGPVSAAAVARATGLSQQTASNTLSDLAIRGDRVVQVPADQLVRQIDPGTRVAYILGERLDRPRGDAVVVRAESAAALHRARAATPRRTRHVGALDTRDTGPDLRAEADRETILAWARRNGAQLPDKSWADAGPPAPKETAP